MLVDGQSDAEIVTGDTSAREVTRFRPCRAKSYLIQRFGRWLRKRYARGWLVLTGVGQAKELFQEIEAILEKIGCVSFIVPDMTTIQRNLETYENQRKREKARKAEKSLSQLIKDLADVNPDDLSAEQRQQLYKLLFSKSDQQE